MKDKHLPCYIKVVYGIQVLSETQGAMAGNSPFLFALVDVGLQVNTPPYTAFRIPQQHTVFTAHLDLLFMDTKCRIHTA